MSRTSLCFSHHSSDCHGDRVISAWKKESSKKCEACDRIDGRERRRRGIVQIGDIEEDADTGVENTIAVIEELNKCFGISNNFKNTTNKET